MKLPEKEYAEKRTGSVDPLVETLFQHYEGHPIYQISGIPTLEGIFVKRIDSSRCPEESERKRTK